MSLKLATLIYMSFSDRFFATKLPNGPDGHRSGEWWTEGNLFLNTKGNKFEHVPFKLFRERTGLSNVVPYDYRHLWCTWLGNHKVSFTESLFYCCSLFVHNYGNISKDKSTEEILF